LQWKGSKVEAEYHTATHRGCGDRNDRLFSRFFSVLVVLVVIMQPLYPLANSNGECRGDGPVEMSD
jgi:hypothetical protein